MSPDYILDQTFTHRTASHEYHIQWTRLGETKSTPLVFIHGTPWSNVVWRDLVTTLSTRYCVYLYDHPGFGDSPVPQRSINAEDQEKIDLDGALTLRAEASAAMFKHWNLTSPPHVVSHDNGGLVSLRLLLQHGIEFASLCLIDVVVFGPSGLPFFKLVAENEDVFKAIPPHLIEGFVRGYVRSATSKPMSKEVEDLLTAPWLPSGKQGPNRFLKEMVQAHNRDTSDIENKYDGIAARSPVKIIWGKDDSWLPFQIAEKVNKALNAEEVVVVPEAGHLIHYDQPSTLALELGLWFDKHKKRST